MTYCVNKSVNSRPIDTIMNECSTEISGQRVDRRELFMYIIKIVSFGLPFWVLRSQVDPVRRFRDRRSTVCRPYFSLVVCMSPKSIECCWLLAFSTGRKLGNAIYINEHTWPSSPLTWERKFRRNDNYTKMNNKTRVNKRGKV